MNVRAALETEIHCEEKAPIRSGTAFSLGIALSFSAGIVLSNAELACGKVPLCAAFCGCLSPYSAGAAFVGAALSAIISQKFNERLAELISLLLITAARAMLPACRSRTGTALTAGTAYLAAAIFTGVISGMSAAAAAAAVFRSLVCGGAAFFFRTAHSAFLSGRQMFCGDSMGISCAVACALLSAAVISFFSEMSFNFGIFLLITVCGGASGIGRLRGGTAAGILASFSIVLSGISEAGGGGAKLAAAACIGCTAMGLMSPKGRFASSAAGLFTMSAVLALLGFPAASSGFIMSSAIGLAAYIVIPERLWTGMFSFSSRKTDRTSRFAMEAISSALNSAAEDSAAAARIFERRIPVYELSAEVCKAVCKNCRCREICRHALSNGRSDEFRRAENIAADKGFITAAELPRGFSDCRHREEIAEYFCVACRRLNRIRNERRKLEAMRLTVCSAIKASADSFSGYSELSAHKGHICRELSSAAEKAISDMGADDVSAAVYSGDHGEFYIEAYCKSLPEIEPNTISEALSNVLNTETETAEISEYGNRSRIACTSLTDIAADFGTAALSGREALSGDSAKCFFDGSGRLWTILSDGMGSGEEAAAESSMTVSLLSRLVRLGIPPKAAAAYTNSILLTKSENEIFATADIFSVDLFSGEAKLFKYGAAFTSVMTKSGFTELSACTPPLGIIPEVFCEERSFHLSAGDTVLMMTDGVPEDIYPKVKNTLALCRKEGISAQTAAQRICELVPTVNGKPTDDVTVAVIFLY